MPIDQNDPFAGVDFTAQDTTSPETGPALTPSITMDEMSSILKSLGNTGSINVGISAPRVVADTSKGVSRVNDNPDAHPGVVGYRDGKGQAVFTNVGTQNAGVGGTAPAGPATLAQQAGLVPVEKPLPINSILEALNKTTDSGAARGLFTSFQEATAREQMRIQNEAQTFAANKIGIPTLEANLTASEQADRADPKWYPGIGDSPITQKARAELNVARGIAHTETTSYLNNNLGYKMLDNSLKQAQAEMQRIQKLTDSKERMQESRDLTDANRTAQREQALELQAEGMSAVELQRIQALSSPEDFKDVTNPKVKAFQIFQRNPNKDFKAAITAQGEELPILAIKGNAFAERLFVTDEAQKTNMPEDYVRAQIKSMKKFVDSLNSPKAMENALKARYTVNGVFDKKAFQAEMGTITAAGFDPTKEGKVSDTKIRLALEAVARQKTEKYLGDTSSWDSIDPLFRAAQDQALKTTGKRDLVNTLTAYLGDTTGPERLAKAAAFDAMAKIASNKHAESAFGKPDYGQAAAIIARSVVAEGTFRAWLNSKLAEAAKVKLPVSGVGGPSTASRNAMLAGTGGPLGSMLGVADAAMTGANDFFGPDKTPINPLTNRPFGE